MQNSNSKFQLCLTNQPNGAGDNHHFDSREWHPRDKHLCVPQLSARLFVLQNSAGLLFHRFHRPGICLGVVVGPLFAVVDHKAHLGAEERSQCLDREAVCRSDVLQSVDLSGFGAEPTEGGSRDGHQENGWLSFDTEESI